MNDLPEGGRWRSLATFVAVAVLLAWIAIAPLWFGDGLQSPLASLSTQIMMFTPTVAALVVVFFVERPRNKARALGLVPVRPTRRLLFYLTIALALPIALCIAALAIGAALGLYPADFTHFSGFEQIVGARHDEAGDRASTLPIQAVVAVQLVNIVIGALFINLLPALGEEIGWRGWLLPRLLRFGAWPAVAISGVVWGVWHAPVILLGHNYPGSPGWLAMLAMVCFCTVIGAILGWLRLRSGSVWPAALGHSTLNAAATMYVLFIAKDGRFDPLQANITGWSGWIVPLALVVYIVASGKFAPATSPRMAGRLDSGGQRTSEDFEA